MRIIKDILNGLYSGIPLCCCLYYIKLGKHPAIQDLKIRNIPYCLVDNGFHYLTNERSYDYVVCPKCRKNNRIVEIKNNGLLWR